MFGLGVRGHARGRRGDVVAQWVLREIGKTLPTVPSAQPETQSAAWRDSPSFLRQEKILSLHRKHKRGVNYNGRIRMNQKNLSPTSYDRSGP